MRKKLFILLALMIAVTPAISACGRRNGGEAIDSSKSQLYVYNYNGGVGSQWLEDAKAGFEALYAETSFEPEKTGVQIIIDKQKDLGPELTNKIASSYNNVFFGERIPYYSWAQKGLLLDISDMVTETVPGEAVSIESKLSGDTKSMLKSYGNKYYGLPHYEGFLGIIYDVDVFEAKSLYFTPSGTMASSSAAARSNGPDGIAGTDDDGLPASLAQFETLCTTMTQRGVTPFMWTGQYSEYYTILLNAFSTAFLGKEQSEVLYHFNGGREARGEEMITSKVITDFNGNSPVIEDKVITESTGNLLFQQAGLYYAIDMGYKILNQTSGSKWFHSDSVNPSFSHLDAQEAFVYGAVEGNDIGMLIEGNYWENEASNAINRLKEENKNSETAQNRRFGWMPLPGVVSGNSGTTTPTLKDSMQSYGVINANIKDNADKVALAKKFLQYCYTDEMLRDFTVTTGMTRPVEYALNESELGELSYFARNMWNYRKTADIVNTATTSLLYFNAESELVSEFWLTTVKGTKYYRPFNALYNKPPVSAKEYFLGMSRSSTEWDSKYREYFEYED